MDIYRIWKVCAQGSLERLLALSGTLYKWLSHRGVHPSSGPIIQFPSFAQDSQISYRLQPVWPISPLLLMDSSQIWYRWKGIFEENPTPYVTKDEDYFLWKTSAITEIAPLGSFQRYWWLSNPDSSFLDVSPSAQDVLLQFGTDLVEIWAILDQKHDFH